jgi:hypothetical protein
MPDLTTIDALKQWLGETTDKSDDALTHVVSAASAFVESYCQRKFNSDTYTEYHDGTDAETLNLNQFPIISVTGVYEGGSAVSLVTGVDPYANPQPEIVIYQEEGKLVRPFSSFFGYRRYYKVIYVAGYATIPADLVDATLNVAALMLREKDRVGIAMKQGSSQTVQFVRSLPETTQRTLERYRDLTLRRAA